MSELIMVIQRPPSEGCITKKQKGGDVRKKMVKEKYCKPEIRSEEIEVGVYGGYPIPEMQPYLHLCPPCT